MLLQLMSTVVAQHISEYMLYLNILVDIVLRSIFFHLLHIDKS